MTQCMLVLKELLAAPRMLSIPVGAGPFGSFSGVSALGRQGLDKAHRHGMDWLGGEEETDGEAKYLPQEEEKKWG